MGWLSIEGAGLIAQLVSAITNRPNTKLNNSAVSIHYDIIGDGINLIKSFVVSLEFNNFSKIQCIVTDFKARYYDGQEWFELYYLEAALPPSYTIPAKSTSSIDIVYLPSIKMDLPIGIFTGQDIVHIELSYKISSKVKKSFIHDVRLIHDNPNRYSWVAI